jgi:predicted nucleic acid-binding protein
VILIDSNVVIRVFKNNEFLDSLKELDVAVCTVVIIELLQGSKSKEEVKKLDEFVQLKFEHILNTSEDLETALELVRRYSSSSGILLGDAIIGATAINRNIPLFTFNQRHFRYPEIKPLLFRV